MRIILSITALLLICQSMFAQSDLLVQEQKAYQDKVAERSILFRGKQAERYSFPANGHVYWESPEFFQATIEFEGRVYYDIPVNIEVVSQRALVRLPGSLLSVALSPETVSGIYCGERFFTGIGPGEALPEGFYEVFGTGKERVYKHVSKRLQTSTSDVNGDNIGYYDPNYNSEITRYFAIRKVYYFRDAEGRFSQIKGRGALIRKFPDRKKELRKAVKASRLDLPSVKYDDFCRGLLRIAEQ